MIKRLLSYYRKHLLYKAYPELRLIDEAQALARKQHKPTAHFDKARVALITSALKGRA